MDAKDYKAFHSDQMSLLAGESNKTAVAKNACHGERPLIS